MTSDPDNRSGRTQPQNRDGSGNPGSEDRDAAHLERTAPADIRENPGSADGDTAYLQSHWSWAWPLILWGVLIFVQMFAMGDPLFALLFVFLAALMTLPRYLRWKSTSYGVSGDGVTVAHQTFAGRQDFRIEPSEIISVEVTRGAVARVLGYKTVELLLTDGGIAKLTFVPVDSGLEAAIRSIKEGSA